MDLYIACDGRDDHPGTLRAPLASLERARDLIRQARVGQREARGVADVTVWMRGGVYERRQTFELDSKDSGVTYRAFRGELVRIIGGQRITGFAPVTDPAVLQRLPAEARGNVVCINLGEIGVANWGTLRARGFCRPYANAALELFVDGTPLRLARWPKVGYIPITQVIDPGSKPRTGDTTGRGATFVCGSERLAHWADVPDAWVHGSFGTVWADDTIAVAKIDAQRRQITLAEPHLYGVKGGSCFVFNLLEELSEPGEWYLDRSTGVLYVYPPGPVDSAEVCVSLLEEPMVALEGASGVTFRGLTFEISRGMGIYIEGGEGNLIAGCTLRNLGTVAVCMGRGVAGPPGPMHEFTGTPVSRTIGNIHGHFYENMAWNRGAGTGHGVLSCDISDCGEGGILLSGGDRRTLEPGGCFAHNCHLYRTNRLTRTYRPAIHIDGVGNRATRNLIHDLPHSAIMFLGNDHLIEANDIRGTVTDSDDGGAIYSGRDITTHGNIIRGNFISGTRGGDLRFRSAIYLDDQVGGVAIIDNILHACSIAAVVSGRHNQVTGNLVIDCEKGIGLDGRPISEYHRDVWRQVVGDPPAEAWRRRYPQVCAAPQEHWGKPVGVSARGNTAVGCEPILFELDVDVSFLEVAGNRRVELDPTWTRRLEGIGLLIDEHRRSLPTPPPLP